MAEITYARIGDGVRRAAVGRSAEEEARAQAVAAARRALAETVDLPANAPAWARNLAAKVEALARLLDDGVTP